ncbi:hypothetical protein ACHAWX_000184 [Stephanocyclus meneghinianus]
MITSLHFVHTAHHTYCFDGPVRSWIVTWLFHWDLVAITSPNLII